MDELIGHIEEPNQWLARKFCRTHSTALREARGSAHKHQAWVGGYLDHVTEVMNICYVLWYVMDMLRGPLLFSLSDTLLAAFLHDAEKPFKYMVMPDGTYVIKSEFRAKSDQHAFREKLFREAGFVLSQNCRNGIDYAEGELGDKYSSTERGMQPIAAIVHAADVLSARLFHDYPLEDPSIDTWRAKRSKFSPP